MSKKYYLPANAELNSTRSVSFLRGKEVYKSYAEYRIRTYVGTKPADFESAPFDRSGNSAHLIKIPEIVNIKIFRTEYIKKILNYHTWLSKNLC